MKELNGIKLKEFPFQNLEEIGLVLFHEFPATTIYKTPDYKSILVEWIDCSAQGQDRFIAYESLNTDLTQYLDGKLSHFNLIKLAVREQIVVFEGSLSTIINPRLVAFNDLPIDCLPDQDVFLDKSDIVEYKKITDYVSQLKKHSYPVHEYSQASVAESSAEYSSESFEEFSMTIKFNAIDLIDGSYSFSEGGQKYTGYFDPLFNTAALSALNFIDFYTIQIKRITQKTTSKRAPVVTDWIASLIRKP